MSLCTPIASSAATVSGNQYVGGITGFGPAVIAKIEDCIYTGSSVTGTNNVGAITGGVSSSSNGLVNCYTTNAMTSIGSGENGMFLYSSAPATGLYYPITIMDYTGYANCTVSNLHDGYLTDGTNPTDIVPVVKDATGNEFTAGTDYTISYSPNASPIAAGNYTMTITGKAANGYSGSLTQEIKVLAQLPGSGRDLEKVRSVFPKSFNFNHVPITSGTALSDWFTQRKNAILLDKFYALVKHKIQPVEFKIEPTLDIDGNLDLGVSWKSNPVYDIIRIDALSTSAKEFEFNPELPKSTADEEDILDAGKFNYQKASILTPTFKTIKGNVIAKASFDVPYEGELSKLGFEAPKFQASAPMEDWMFCYPLPFWLFCLIVALIIIYIVLVARAFGRNNSSFYRINGKFEVTFSGEPVTERKKAQGLNMVDFGKGAGFLSVPDANWHIKIDVKRHNPFLRPLKHPEYIVTMLKGSAFKTDVKYGPHQHPSIARFTRITVGDFRVRWLN